MTESVDLFAKPGNAGEPDRLLLRRSAHLVDHGEEVKQLLWSAVMDAIHAPERQRRVAFAARGLEDSREMVAKWALSTQTSVRNSQVNGGFDISGRTANLNEWAYRHGVTLTRVVNEVTAKHYPLLPLTSLHCHHIAVAPVRLAMILFDETHLGFAGPPFDSGDSSLWWTTDSALVNAARELVLAQSRDGHGIEPLPPTAVNHRRLWVLIHLLNGLTDTAIARRLDVSLRVVERDVHHIKELAGVNTRMEIVWGLGFGGTASSNG
ncbi:hypothetical protein ACOCJ7_03785 [Knoellia sp. CPCC 206453]|uniref:helix-turn-helix transcriptional regulator n=1 Tax=Knoellia pratensis TaxID=3404796 RepID=UPI00360F5918